MSVKPPVRIAFFTLGGVSSNEANKNLAETYALILGFEVQEC